MGAPKAPNIKPIPPTPTEVDPSVIAAVKQQKAIAATKEGRGATLLTTPQGLIGGGSSKKTLLGI